MIERDRERETERERRGKERERGGDNFRILLFEENKKTDSNNSFI